MVNYSAIPTLAHWWWGMGFVLAFSIPAWGQSSEGLADRHYVLANTLGIDLQKLEDQSPQQNLYVHWLYLNQDELIDAVVILKPDSESCGVNADCTGKLLVATDEGFRVVSAFLPNHHPIYFSSFKEGRNFRNFYFTEDGVNFTELTFRNERYHLKRHNLSLALVEDMAPRIVNEKQFDNLAKQITAVEQSETQPLGAPIVLKVVTPPVSNITPLIKISYQLTQDLQPEINKFLSNFAQTYSLSHTVTVELVPCGDWVARIPLQNQRDRSSGHVVVCQEIFAMADGQFLSMFEKEYVQELETYIQKKIDQGDKFWTSSKLEKRLQIVKENFRQTKLSQLKDLNTEEQIKALTFIIMGSLGQPLSLQENAVAKVLMHIDKDESTDGNILKRSRRTLTQQPVYLYYLFSSLLVVRDISPSELMAIDIVTRLITHVNFIKQYEVDRKEYAVFKKDMTMRLWAGACAERNKKDRAQKPLWVYYEKAFKKEDWQVCDHFRNILHELSRESVHRK